jgi:hypothetical protein
MQVQPAHVDQVQRGTSGHMELIDADVGGVAEDLKRIDAHLKVRFAESGNPPFFAVYWESDDRRSTYLVFTQRALLTRHGTWSGLDQRIVRRIEEIDTHGRSGYDIAQDLERNHKQQQQRRKQHNHEVLGGLGEQAAHAIRKDLGERYRGRAFITKKPEDLT